VRGLVPDEAQKKALGIAPLELELDAAARAEIGPMDEHAGFDETSRLLFFRPDLVDPGYATLPSITVGGPDEFFAKARVAGWPGYLSAPRLATAAHGARIAGWRLDRDAALVSAIVEGRLDERDIPRYAQYMLGDPQVTGALRGSDDNERDRARKQAAWLERNGLQ
jgi:hypothetical protein